MPYPGAQLKHLIRGATWVYLTSGRAAREPKGRVVAVLYKQTVCNGSIDKRFFRGDDSVFVEFLNLNL